MRALIYKWDVSFINERPAQAACDARGAARARARAGVRTCIHIRGRLGRPDSHHVRTLSRLVSISAPINVRCTDAVMALDASTVQAISTALAGALSPLLQASQQSAATADPSQQSAATARAGPSQPSQSAAIRSASGSGRLVSFTD